MVQRIKLLQQLLLCVGFIVLAVSCEREEPDKPKEPKKFYLSVGLNIGNVAPSLRDYTGLSEGTPEERSVRRVRLVLYDGNALNSTVAEVIDYDIKTTDSGTDKWTGTDVAPTTDKSKGNRVITYGHPIPKKNYYALVIINATDAMKTETVIGKTFADFQNAHQVITNDKTANVAGLALDNNFAMTNAKGLIKVEEAQYLYNSLGAAHDNPVEIAVERMVAKVTLTTPDGVSIPCDPAMGAVAGNLTWELDIVNKWTYWMRKSTITDGTTSDLWYAEDPNYTNFGQLPEVDRTKQFYYCLSKGKTATSLSKALNESEYCLENTMHQTEQSYDKIITRVLVRLVYKPKKISTLGEGYCVIPDDANTLQVYSLQEMKDVYAVALEEKLTNTTSKLSDIVLASGYDFSTGDIPLLNGSPATESFDTGSMKYYHGGVNYYALKVLHFGTNDVSPYAHGHYGIVRNNHYTVQLENIMGPGAATLESADITTRSTATEDSSLYTNIHATIKHIQQ